jgi:uncharacterized protein (DUF2141 family)
MRKMFLVCSALFLVSYYSFSQYTLRIDIIGISNNTGNIMLQLFDGNEEVLAQVMSAIKDQKCSFMIENLKPGKYAVRYYHDQNLNNKMDTNLLGKPTEGYGFSNNVTGKFGPPTFEKWLFEISENKTIVLKPTY